MASLTESQLLLEVYYLLLKGGEKQAVHLIFQWVNEEIKQNRSMRVNTVLGAANPQDMNEDLMVGYLASTYPFKAYLPNRNKFAERCRTRLIPLIGSIEAHRLIDEML